MKLLGLVGVLLVVGATAPATAESPSTLKAVVADGARGSLGDLLTPTDKPVRLRITYCRGTVKHGSCRVRVWGTSTCKLRMQVRDKPYGLGLWASRMRCR